MSKRKSVNRKAMTATSLLVLIGYVLAVMILLFVILPIGGEFFGLTIGGTAEAANSIDASFNRLMKQIAALELEPEGTQRTEGITVDKDFYLVSFNKGETKNGKASKPPECSGAACLCVCINDDCTKIDVNNNRGRDCRKLPNYNYNAIIAQQGIDGNSGTQQVKKENTYLDGSSGFYFYVKGFKTLLITLQKKTINSVTNLYIGKGK